MASESKAAIFAAIAGNFAVAAVKFVTAAFTGSSAMLSEGIHSLIDTGDGVLLWIGVKRSRRPADEEHPFGHGKELYFWSLVVAMIIFAAGGVVTAYEGLLHILDPEPIENVAWNFVALGAAALFESISLSVAWRQFRKNTGTSPGWRAIRRSKDPSVFTVVFEDSAALLGITIAAVGIGAAEYLGIPELDGAASMAIGALLCTVAVLLGRECMSLLVGEGVDLKTQNRIRGIAERQPGVVRAGAPLTMYFGPDAMLVNLSVEFRPDLGAQQVTRSLDAMEEQMRREFPQIKRIFISAEAYEQGPRAPFGAR